MNMKINLHAPGGGRTTTHESLAGAPDIPEGMPSNQQRSLKVNIAGVELKNPVMTASGTFGDRKSVV